MLLCCFSLPTASGPVSQRCIGGCRYRPGLEAWGGLIKYVEEEQGYAAVPKGERRIHLRFSTPSRYFTAVRHAHVSLPRWSGDLVPYADRCIATTTPRVCTPPAHAPPRTPTGKTRGGPATTAVGTARDSSPPTQRLLRLLAPLTIVVFALFFRPALKSLVHAASAAAHAATLTSALAHAEAGTLPSDAQAEALQGVRRARSESRTADLPSRGPAGNGRALGTFRIWQAARR